MEDESFWLKGLGQILHSLLQKKTPCAFELEHFPSWEPQDSILNYVCWHGLAFLATGCFTIWKAIAISLCIVQVLKVLPYSLFLEDQICSHEKPVLFN